VLDGVEAMARAEGIRSIAFLYVPPEDLPLRRALRDRGYAEFGPTHNVAVLRVPGRTFGDYLAGFGKRRRDSIGWERRKIAAAGVQISVEELTSDLSREMLPLEAQLYGKYGTEHPTEMARLLHESVMREYGKSDPVITARSAGVLRGYAAFIQVHETLYSRDTGYDYAWPEKLPLYFEVLFYSAIELAMQSGVREIYYSYGSDDTKASRGCDLCPRLGYVKALDAEASDELDSLCAELAGRQAI
jgi:predicted N-acyltransferase